MKGRVFAVCCVYVCKVLTKISSKMDVYSLEEDENQLFLTQRDSQRDSTSEESLILRNPLDFASPCASLLGVKQDQYSDISDDEFDIPCSQKTMKLK